MIYGTTNDHENDEITFHHHIDINYTDDEITIYYNITGLLPSLQYTFTVYVLDFSNTMKNQTNITFCEFCYYM